MGLCHLFYKTSIPKSHWRRRLTVVQDTLNEDGAA